MACNWQQQTWATARRRAGAAATEYAEHKRGHQRTAEACQAPAPCGSPRAPRLRRREPSCIAWQQQSASSRAASLRASKEVSVLLACGVGRVRPRSSAGLRQVPATPWQGCRLRCEPDGTGIVTSCSWLIGVAGEGRLRPLPKEVSRFLPAG